MLHPPSVPPAGLRRCALGLALAPAALTALPACDWAEDDLADVGGIWTGTVALSSVLGSADTTLDIAQDGEALTGRMTVGTYFADRAFNGRLDADSTIAWTVTFGCEIWNGVLFVRRSGTDLYGPLSADRSACLNASVSSGTLSLER